MTIQEAIKSGKPFKRPHHAGYAVYVKRCENPSKSLKEMPPLQWIDNDGNRYGRLVLNMESYNANDWEVKSGEKGEGR